MSGKTGSNSDDLHRMRISAVDIKVLFILF